MWTFSDDHGIHPAKPKTLKAELYPMDDVTSTVVEGWVQELIEAGLVQQFDRDSSSYWLITGWEKHQKIDKPSYKYPTPSEAANSPSSIRALAEDSSNGSRAPSPGVDRKGVDRKGVDQAFATFWSLYPKKVAKPAAVKAFNTVKAGNVLATILANVESRKASDDWQKEGGKYIPNPATYLNQRRWEDVSSAGSDTLTNKNPWEGAR
jgi:hypothetical protein